MKWVVLVLVLLPTLLMGQTFYEMTTDSVQATYIRNRSGEDDYNYGASTLFRWGWDDAGYSQHPVLWFPIPVSEAGYHAIACTLFVRVAGTSFGCAAGGDTLRLWAATRDMSTSEGAQTGGTANAGECSWNDYSAPNEWTTPGGDYSTRVATVFINSLDWYAIPLDTAWLTTVLNGSVAWNGIIGTHYASSGNDCRCDFRSNETTEGDSVKPYGHMWFDSEEIPASHKKVLIRK